jgi:hypothetical protein
MRHLIRFLLVILAGLLYAAGWVAGRIANVVLWCWSGLAVGWDSAREAPAPVDAPLKRVA